jgi:hypothetical protein
VDRCMTGAGGGGLTTPSSSPSSLAADRVGAAPSSPSPSADPPGVEAPVAPSAPSLPSDFDVAAAVSAAGSCAFATAVAAERVSSAIAVVAASDGCDHKSVRVAAAAAADREVRERSRRGAQRVSAALMHESIDDRCSTHLPVTLLAFLVPLPQIPRTAQQRATRRRVSAMRRSQQRIDRLPRWLLFIHHSTATRPTAAMSACSFDMQCAN